MLAWIWVVFCGRGAYGAGTEASMIGKGGSTRVGRGVDVSKLCIVSDAGLPCLLSKNSLSALRAKPTGL